VTAQIYDVVAIGNAIVDVIAKADDRFLNAQQLTKGAMRLIDTAEAERLYQLMGVGLESSGGSAANSMAGLAALGGQAAFIGQVAHDPLGHLFGDDIGKQGVAFTTAPLHNSDPTARCLILVTPDGQRTMNTYLGASQHLPVTALDHTLIAAGGILYLEGYLWDPPAPRAAMRAAIAIARNAGRQVAFTLSDGFCVDRHRGDFQALLDEGLIDILFANEQELCALVETHDLTTAISAVAPKANTLVVTRGEHGAVAVSGTAQAQVAAEPVAQVVDTTGAGDLFAAGFLYGAARALPLGQSLKIGAIAAAEIISHFGARPAADLQKLIAGRI
jgi:sugar/nucleoside kinase (ribokinase family)